MNKPATRNETFWWLIFNVATLITILIVAKGTN